ncbi:unnamed protein product [Caenorhabditis auriculariae]|uniref:EGF-like domain-containing protein n=1 Tax=Caenorhabditis auriculariae TaxID=2777116 RepID=A0A8S1H8P1_9PELO|nr:unnamed protein product [Caenorhabditis auriculariae]
MEGGVFSCCDSSKRSSRHGERCKLIFKRVGSETKQWTFCGDDAQSLVLPHSFRIAIVALILSETLRPHRASFVLLFALFHFCLSHGKKMEEVPSKEDIMKSVNMAIKKEGNYDKVRRQAIRNLSEQEPIKAWEKQLAENVSIRLRNLPSKATREDMKREVDRIMNFKDNFKQVMNSCRYELEKEWACEDLEHVIDSKIRTALKLPPLEKNKIPPEEPEPEDQPMDIYEEETQKLLLSFNDDFEQTIIDEWTRAVQDEHADVIRVKIGILAMYFRVFKRIVPWSVDEKGFEHIFPEPLEDFDLELGKCLAGLEKCLDSVIGMINTTEPWILHDDVLLDEASLSLKINSNLMSYMLSATQVLCYMTNSRISAFEQLPYCRYRIPEKGGRTHNWMGKSFYSLVAIDEFIHRPYECATESFCPDPCCRGIPDVVQNSTGYQNFCRLNKCANKDSCSVKPIENDFLMNLRQNKFNISCGCPNTAQIYRSDVNQCVHHDPCTKMNLCRRNFQECINVASDEGYRCLCQLGYILVGTECQPVKFSNANYDGFAETEKLPKTSERLFGFREQIVAPM